MKSSFNLALRRALLVGAAAAVVAPAMVWAQQVPAAPGTAKDKQDAADAKQQAEIVITGTLLRGKAPVGVNLIALGQTKIESEAPLSSNDLLASLPQVTNYFNRVPAADLGIATNQIQISRPNIRNLSPNNASSSATLILVDGHRIASGGVTQASVDPDAIPVGAIERVEVLTEGGSSTYGADAVAGVINFITHKDFEGVKVNASYGVAGANYWQTDAGITAGHKWDSGSAWISYTFTKSSPLFGGDRNYIHALDYSQAPVNGVYPGLSQQCATPNINVTFKDPTGAVNKQIVYPYSAGATSASLVPGTPNTCDSLTHTAVVPKIERDGVMAGWSQDIGDRTSLAAHAFYSRRTSEATSETGVTVGMASANPFSIPPAGVRFGPGNSCTFFVAAFGRSFTGPFCTASNTVSFNFTPLLGNASSFQTTLLKEWGTDLELKHSLGPNWQLRGLLNYSGSDTTFGQQNPNVTALAAAGASTSAATAIDPFNLALTSPSVIQGIMNNENAGEAKDELLNARVVADGRLLTLPGGDVRLAAGYEFMHDNFQQRFETNIPIDTLSSYGFNQYKRSVNSLFGELNIPFVGAGNASGIVQSLVLSASGRYDHYSDFGNTFNPKIGLSYKPVNWINLRGNWGTSFTAPTPLDQLGANTNTLTPFPFVAFTNPASPPGTSGMYTLALQGSQPDLKPEKAKTWSLGFDVNPPFIPGLRAGASFYRVVFNGILETPTPNAGIFQTFPNNVTFNSAGVTQAQISSFGALVPTGAATVAPFLGATPIASVYELVDFRTGNFGILRQSGLDFNANYQHKTGFGSFDLTVNGNYKLSSNQQSSANSPAVNLLTKDNYGKLNLQTIAGINIGIFRAQAAWNHTSGYAVTPTTSVPVHDYISQFNTVDLFFKLDVPTTVPGLGGTSLTLNVKNVANQSPPVYLVSTPSYPGGYANGFTLGRLIIVGIAKKF